MNYKFYYNETETGDPAVDALNHKTAIMSASDIACMIGEVANYEVETMYGQKLLSGNAYQVTFHRGMKIPKVIINALI